MSYVNVLCPLAGAVKKLRALDALPLSGNHGVATLISEIFEADHGTLVR